MNPNDAGKLPLFVYGSLIDPIHRAEVVGRFVEGAPAILYGYARSISRHWYVYRCEGARTEGLVITGLAPDDFARLDRYEDVPSLYTRERIEVMQLSEGRVRCWVYLPTAWADSSEE